jgi:hypothetical protein
MRFEDKLNIAEMKAAGATTTHSPPLAVNFSLL